MSLLSKLTQVANSKQGKELIEKAKTIANDPKTREKIEEACGKITEQVDAAKHKLAEKKAKDEESKAAGSAAAEAVAEAPAPGAAALPDEPPTTAGDGDPHAA
jgi:hypothetical protein